MTQNELNGIAWIAMRQITDSRRQTRWQRKRRDKRTHDWLPRLVPRRCIPLPLPTNGHLLGPKMARKSVAEVTWLAMTAEIGKSHR